MEYPLISIIIPVYNVSKYLRKCIESVICQSYKNIEIILVDDGSKDDSGKICDEYAKNDSRIKVIHKENNGVSAARNTGIESSNGKYLCFVDGDDYVMKDYVEYLFKLLKKNDADISLTTEMFGNFNSNQTENIIYKIWNVEDACEGILCYKVPIGVYCKLFNRDLIIKNKISFFEDIFMGEGFNFNMLSFQNAQKIVVGNRKIYFYRRDNSTSATTKFSLKKCENSLYAMKKMRDNFILHTERIDRAWEYAKWRTYSDAFDYMVLGKGIHDNKEKYREYKKYVKKHGKTCFRVPISKKDKIRAIIMMFWSSLIPMALKIRRKRYKVKIVNDQKGV